MKIGILILLHKYNTQQKLLIEKLSKDFELYIHIDKKSDISINEIQRENVYVYKDFKVYWGSYNQILATLLLYRKAYNNGINRFVLISGQDIPIKSNKYIKKFFENNQYNYLDINKLPYNEWYETHGGLDRVNYFWENVYKDNNDNRILSRFNKVNINIIQYIQKLFNIKRSLSSLYQLYGGANWMDLTDVCVGKIFNYLEMHPDYIKRFKYTRCADEIFFQTIIKNIHDNILIINTSLRYIDWKTGPEYPRILRKDDFDKLMNNDKLFARKVDIDIDIDIISKIYNTI